MKFKAAIFDLDGTLVNAYSAWENGYRKMFESMNHTMTDNEFDRLYRMTSDESAQYVRGIYESQNQGGDGLLPFDTIMGNLAFEMERQYTYEIQAKPYALEYVQMLHMRRIPICVATLSPMKLAAKVLPRTGFMPYLKFVITGDDIGLSKKFPDIYLAAAKMLGSTPLETAVYEDCPTAIKTAHKAGFIVCGVSELHQDHSTIYPYCHFRISSYLEACYKAS